MIETYTYPPCYNYNHFHGVGSIIMNDEMGQLLSNVIKFSNFQHSMLNELAKDLNGEPIGQQLGPENNIEPAYDYGYFMKKIILTVNKPMANLIAESINNCEPEMIHNSLWSLYHNLRIFEPLKYRPERVQTSKAI